MMPGVWWMHDFARAPLCRRPGHSQWTQSQKVRESEENWAIKHMFQVHLQRFQHSGFL